MRPISNISVKSKCARSPELIAFLDEMVQIIHQIMSKTRYIPKMQIAINIKLSIARNDDLIQEE